MKKMKANRLSVRGETLRALAPGLLDLVVGGEAELRDSKVMCVAAVASVAPALTCAGS
jgi:hypothetical protein